MKLRYWIDCRLRGKHRYNFYDRRCIVCHKKQRNKIYAG